MTPITPRRTAAIAALVAVAVGAGVVGIADAAAARTTRTCHGLPVTISATRGAITGTPGRDVVALTGPGTVRAGGGRDVICGSPGNDVLEGGAGDDVIVGRAGRDRLAGDAGRDRLYGEQGGDLLVGGPGADVLMGGSGRDTIRRGTQTRTGAHEQQTGDQVVAGTDAISFVATPRSWPRLAAMGMYTQWVQPQGAWPAQGPGVNTQPTAWNPVVGQVLQPSYQGPGGTPLTHTIAFPPVMGAFWGWLPAGVEGMGVSQGQVLSPQGQATFPLGGSTTQADAVNGGISAWTSGSAPDVLNASLFMGGFAVAGFTQDVQVDGQDLGQMPLAAGQVTGGMSFALPQPSQLWLFLGIALDGMGPWAVAAPVPAFAGTQVDFSGPGEVVPVSYDARTGWAKD